MATVTGQLDLPSVATQMEVRKPTVMALMARALELGQVDQLRILQEMHFKQEARDAEIEFNMAMNSVQAEITRVIPDAYNQQTKTKWATYPAMDKMLRPIYVKHGFSLSFDSGESPAGTVIAYCYVSHSNGHTRKYQSPPMPLPTQGPQGKAVMTDTHGTGAAMSYAKRYLLAYIFNIPVGDEDTDGNASNEAEMAGLDDWCTSIRDAHNYEDMDRAFKDAFSKANEIKSESAKSALSKARDDWRKRRKGAL